MGGLWGGHWRLSPLGSKGLLVCSMWPAPIEISNMQSRSPPAICHRFTRRSISGTRTDMKNDTSYFMPLNASSRGRESENARPMGLRGTHVHTATAKARPEFRVLSHQECTFAVYWSMSQSHPLMSRTEIPNVFSSIFKASGQGSANAHLSI